MRILVTGSRQMLDQSRVYRVLDAQLGEWIAEVNVAEDLPDSFTVVHGGAPGADALAGQWCHDRRAWPIVQEVHPARWAEYGNLAGGIRNGEMVRLGADLVLAFFQPGAKNVGTRNCVRRAKLAGLNVLEMWE